MTKTEDSACDRRTTRWTEDPVVRFGATRAVRKTPAPLQGDLLLPFEGLTIDLGSANLRTHGTMSSRTTMITTLLAWTSLWLRRLQLLLRHPSLRTTCISKRAVKDSKDPRMPRLAELLQRPQRCRPLPARIQNCPAMRGTDNSVRISRFWRNSNPSPGQLHLLSHRVEVLLLLPRRQRRHGVLPLLEESFPTIARKE